jgi:hypothetical protein
MRAQFAGYFADQLPEIRSVSACSALATAPTGGTWLAQACPVARMIRRGGALPDRDIYRCVGRDRAVGEIVQMIVDQLPDTVMGNQEIAPPAVRSKL